MILRFRNFLPQAAYQDPLALTEGPHHYPLYPSRGFLCFTRTNATGEVEDDRWKVFLASETWIELVFVSSFAESYSVL